jgi:hypothetical protein
VSDKGGGECAVLFVTACPQDLVQGPPCEPATRERSIDLGNAEWQYPMHCRPWPLDPPDALAEFVEKSPFLDHVPFLFCLWPVVNTVSPPAAAIP